jgi:two-component system chemotaxis response regulator CheY
VARILIVDDSSLSRRMLRRILESADYEVIEAEDGLRAIEQYYLERPDVVLLDITMSQMDGLEVLKQLRQVDPGVAVVMATADVQTSTRELASAAGARGFLTKPYNSDEVIALVGSVLLGDAR